MARGSKNGRGGKGGGKGGGGKGGGRGGSAAGRAAQLAAFDKHFGAAYGARWPTLRTALLAPVEHVAWANPFAASVDVLPVFGSAAWHPHQHVSGTSLMARDGAGEADEPVAMPEAVPVPARPANFHLDANGELQSHYALDGASPLPALALAPRPGHRVLDLCAAPGGKSLVLAGQIFSGAFEREGNRGATAPPVDAHPEAEDGTVAVSPRSLLISNDRSGPRRARLRRVIEEFVPRALLREPAELPVSTWAAERAAERGGGGGVGAAAVTGIDAAQWGRGPAAPPWSTVAFDRILVDAPCSSERHFLHGEGGADAVWSRARLKRDATLQKSILHNAARMLAVGGRLVYSTCSLAEEENDGVVSKLLANKRHGAGLVSADALAGLAGLETLVAGAQRTKLGVLMLPDRSRFGPLYWAVIERRAAADVATTGDSDSESDGSEMDPEGSDCSSEKGHDDRHEDNEALAIN
jgi:16S rRNA C967 or C1407 C5-methylase (RsmB/RsmF family)